ncbi:hypothetical protein [Lacticaseibacillus saniviri]|nr:hypothetical protein [Lacticaseibacillus saniviri]MCG4282722.1 hypothetical protein [Lacticaseibacillus saniviri]
MQRKIGLTVLALVIFSMHFLFPDTTVLQVLLGAAFLVLIWLPDNQHRRQ